MMKSRKELGGGRKNCSWKSGVRRLVHVCWLCAASTVFALLLVSVHHGLMAKFGKNVDVGPLGVSIMAFGLPRCMQCNPYVSKFPVKIRRRSEGEILLQRKFLADDEKFMYYAPHSGFNNQVMELKNALTFAKILNRTLIIPPVLDHHAAWLGSCPKRRALRPHRLRALVWTRIFDLITNSRYTSIADIVDISSITPSKVKTVDLRIFLALWCGVDIRAACGGILCEEFANQVFVWREYEACVQLLNPLLQAEQNCCVYSVDNDCTSTIWTNNPKFLNHTAFAAEELHNESPRGRYSNVVLVDKIEFHKLQNVRRRTLSAGRMSNEWKTEKAKTSEIKLLNIRSSLGPNSPARNSSVLAFGSMFSTSYKGVQSHIDIRTPSGDQDLDVLIHSLKSLPFSSDIVAAGKAYIREEIAQPFYCAQLRLLDGQFKNHWNATFKNFKAQLTSYNSADWSRNPTSVFVMTDLPYENWTQTDLKELLVPKNSYKMHKMDTRKDLIQMASRRVLTGESGFLVGSNPDVMRGLRQNQVQSSILDNIPHVQLAMEEIVCSCARLGFSGTRGSTIADSIANLRSTNICIGLPPGFQSLNVNNNVLQMK